MFVGQSQKQAWLHSLGVRYTGSEVQSPMSPGS